MATPGVVSSVRGGLSVRIGAGVAAAVAKSASTLQLRLATSYKPKSVALLSKSTELLIPSLLEKGWKDKLILDCGRPFEGADFGSRLNAALLHA